MTSIKKNVKSFGYTMQRQAWQKKKSKRKIKQELSTFPGNKYFRLKGKEVSQEK